MSITDSTPKSQAARAPEILTGSGAILKSLKMLGIKDAFGLPGGAIMPFYDELMASTAVRHILVRHEQGAGHAAEGYAAASGGIGVAIATSGPGATNLVTAIADAYMDSVPLLAITGQVFSTVMGTDAFQEVDIVGITMPIVKHSFLVKDPAEIGKIREAQVPIVGDVRDVLVDLAVAYRDAVAAHPADYAAWWQRLTTLRETYPLGWDEPTDGHLSPQKVIQRIGELTGPEAVYAAGVGQHQMWAAQFIRYERPNAWLNSGGAGTMGYAVPAAMGAKVAEPDRVVWAIDGDGCFQMTNQELATCAINGIPIKVAIINNSSLGVVRQWQTLFYEGRHSFTDLETGGGTRMIPDFVKLAEAYDCLAIRVTKEEEIDAAIELALATNDRPVVIDFVVSRDAMVWPMVPQGVGNSSVQYARDHAPHWEED